MANTEGTKGQGEKDLLQPGVDGDGVGEPCDCDDGGDSYAGAGIVGVACNLPGVCGAGEVECDGALRVRCDSVGRNVAATCNALDDNCSGVVDEGLPPDGNFCTRPRLGVTVGAAEAAGIRRFFQTLNLNPGTPNNEAGVAGQPSSDFRTDLEAGRPEGFNGSRLFSVDPREEVLVRDVLEPIDDLPGKRTDIGMDDPTLFMVAVHLRMDRLFRRLKKLLAKKPSK